MNDESETTSVSVEGRVDMPLAAVLLIGAAYGLGLGLALALAALFNAPVRLWAAHFPGGLIGFQSFLVTAGALAGACAATLWTLREKD
jgi:hypothetical protein